MVMIDARNDGNKNVCFVGETGCYEFYFEKGHNSAGYYDDVFCYNKGVQHQSNPVVRVGKCIH